MKKSNGVTVQPPKMRRRAKAHDTKNRRPIFRNEPDTEVSEVFVNRVELDNTIPGGFRLAREVVPQPARS